MPFSDTISTNLLPAKSILVCSTGRSGSTLLGKTLSSLNCLGQCDEFFRPDILVKNSVHSSADELYHYLPDVYRKGTTSNGVFGVKLHWDHMKLLTKIARTDPTLKSKSNIEILTLFFPNPCFVFIRRDNLTKQAISVEIGHQTGIYMIPKDFSGKLTYKDKKLFFKPLNIYRYKQGLQARNNNWRSFFSNNNLPFFEVVYEDFVREFTPTIRQVIEFSGVVLPEEGIEISQATKKQGDKTNENWFRYYSLIPESLLAGYSSVRSLVKKALGARARVVRSQP